MAALPNPVSAQSLPGEVLSPSQASTFLVCSAKWWFRYGLGLPDPPAGGAVRGKVIHRMIEYWMSAKVAGVQLESGAFMDAYDSAWDEASADAEFHSTDKIDELKASGALLTQKYLSEVAPSLEPAAVEMPFTTTIAGVTVRGIIDLVDSRGRVIDIKTSSRKPSGLSSEHAFQLATYVEALPHASGAARIDTLVSTKDPQLVQIEHTPGEQGKRLVERLYPMVAEGIAGGLYMPNRSSNLCSRRYCAFADACEREFGGTVE